MCQAARNVRAASRPLERTARNAPRHSCCARFPPSARVPLAQASAIRQVEHASAHYVSVPSRACRPGGGRSEHAVAIARKMLRRPATPRGVGGPRARSEDEAGAAFFRYAEPDAAGPACSRRNFRNSRTQYFAATPSSGFPCRRAFSRGGSGACSGSGARGPAGRALPLGLTCSFRGAIRSRNGHLPIRSR